jgi:hypothetical protein
MCERTKLGRVDVIRVTGKKPGLRSSGTLGVQDVSKIALVAVRKRTMEKLVDGKRMEFRIRTDDRDTGKFRVDRF